MNKGKIMSIKKIVLLSTIICVSALNGMQDIGSVIITKALETSNDADEAIATIKKLSEAYGVQFDRLFENDLKGYTAMVHMIADKFDEDPLYIAARFALLIPYVPKEWKTLNDLPSTKRYSILSSLLNVAIRNGNLSEVKKLITEGADVKARRSIISENLEQLLHHESSAEIVKLLVANGADPNKALKTLNKKYRNSPQYAQIKALLEEAMIKWKEKS